MSTVAPRPTASRLKSDESASAHEPSVPTSSEKASEESPTGHAPRAERQSIGYCPYCSEENLFPLEGGGWECRSCLRAFSVVFRGLVASSRVREEGPVLTDRRGTTPLDPREEQS